MCTTLFFRLQYLQSPGKVDFRKVNKGECMVDWKGRLAVKKLSEARFSSKHGNKEQ